MALGKNFGSICRQWKGGGIDGRVSPRTGASERIVLAHWSGTRRGYVPSGEFVGTRPSLFPRDDKRAPDARSWWRQRAVASWFWVGILGMGPMQGMNPFTVHEVRVRSCLLYTPTCGNVVNLFVTNPMTKKCWTQKTLERLKDWNTGEAELLKRVCHQQVVSRSEKLLWLLICRFLCVSTVNIHITHDYRPGNNYPGQETDRYKCGVNPYETSPCFTCFEKIVYYEGTQRIKREINKESVSVPQPENVGLSNPENFGLSNVRY
jgi:hypothetical protein